MNMKHFLLTTLLALIMGIGAYGQTNLTGRVYYNANIMASEFDEKLKELDKEIANKRTETIAAMEKKKGRKLTASEEAELNKELNQAMNKAKTMMKEGMKTAVTMEFKSAKEVVMKMEMKVDDAVLKAAGVSWIKRKAMKAAMALSPSQKETYVVKGNQVIIGTGKDQDTMTLSADGKTLTGTMDGKKFTLTRTK
ncbi:MAG: hypothetical protein J6M41_11200 [Prevotella sp.]|nr:hypothetical protein [Prevotella sp.]